jgi:hypothetical protein
MTISLCFRLMSMLVLLVMKLLYCTVQYKAVQQGSTAVSRQYNCGSEALVQCLLRANVDAGVSVKTSCVSLV